MLDKTTEAEIENIAEFVLSQNQQIIHKAIQIMISFHDVPSH
jgi:hypothetical protein